MGSRAWTLGFGSALMIVSGYYGELVVTGDLTPRWSCWFASMAFFLYIVYELLVGLSEATNSEADPAVKSKIQNAQLMTVISWCTYPIVYLFPMIGINAAHSVVSIQIGYCVSDIISKCGVGLLIYQITYAKSSGMSPAWSRLEETLGSSSGSPSDEAARKLISNYDAVINDICNPMPLTQGYLRRVSPIAKDTSTRCCARLHAVCSDKHLRRSATGGMPCSLRRGQVPQPTSRIAHNHRLSNVQAVRPT